MKSLRLLAPILLLAGTSLARADEVTIQASGLLCNTMAQLQSIVDASKTNPEAANVIYRELVATPDEKGEPTCAFVDLDGVSATDAKTLGVLKTEDGEFDAVGLHVKGKNNSEGWLMVVKPAEKRGFVI